MLNVHLTDKTAGLLHKMLAALAIGMVALAFVATRQRPRPTARKGLADRRAVQIENDCKGGNRAGRHENRLVHLLARTVEWHFGWLINAIKAPSKIAQPGRLGSLAPRRRCRVVARPRRALKRRSQMRPYSRHRLLPPAGTSPRDEPVAATPPRGCGRRQVIRLDLPA